MLGLLVLLVAAGALGYFIAQYRSERAKSEAQAEQEGAEESEE